jgi:hypothetical protein
VKHRYCAITTWESATQAPETVRAEIVAGTWHSAALRALRGAKTAVFRRRIRSVVVVLERLSPQEDTSCQRTIPGSV